MASHHPSFADQSLSFSLRAKEAPAMDCTIFVVADRNVRGFDDAGGLLSKHPSVRDRKSWLD